MKKFMWLAFLAVVFAAPAFAQDSFDVGYRQESVVVGTNTVTGKLLISVYNVSGREARDVTVTIPGRNNVTYDNRSIFIGNLQDGQRVEVLDVFSVPVELMTSEKMENQAGVDVEFTSATGERTSVHVTGRNVQPNS